MKILWGLPPRRKNAPLLEIKTRKMFKSQKKSSSWLGKTSKKGFGAKVLKE
jgi:hypothetical protein